MAVLPGYGRLCTSWVWLAPSNSFTPPPLLDSLVRRNPTQTFKNGFSPYEETPHEHLRDISLLKLHIYRRVFMWP